MGRKIKSIMQEDLTRCWECGAFGTEKHHVIFGRANRKLADKYGLIVGLCYRHHRGEEGVHGRDGKQINEVLKYYAQDAFEKVHGSRSDFIQIFGKSYK